MKQPLRRPYDGEATRRAILAVARPGQLLPPLAEIARMIGTTQPIVSWHLDRLRDEWRIVTRIVNVKVPGTWRPHRRLMVLEIDKPNLKPPKLILRRDDRGLRLVKEPAP